MDKTSTVDTISSEAPGTSQQSTNNFSGPVYVLGSKNFIGGITNQRNEENKGAQASSSSEDMKLYYSTTLWVAGGSPGIILQRNTLSGCEDIELPGAPSVPIIIVESHDSMGLKWNPPLKGGQFVTHYSICYQDGNTDNWATQHTPVGAATSFVVKGLEPGSTYVFKIAAESEFGRSPFSPCCAPRLTLPCGPPRGLKLIKASSSDLSVAWDPSPLASYVVKYLVEYRIQGETKPWIPHAGIDNSTSCVLSKLSPKTSYKVRIKALCSNGKVSLPSETTVFTTQSDEEDRLAKRVRDSAGTQPQTSSEAVGTSQPSITNHFNCQININGADNVSLGGNLGTFIRKGEIGDWKNHFYPINGAPYEPMD